MMTTTITVLSVFEYPKILLLTDLWAFAVLGLSIIIWALYIITCPNLVKATNIYHNFEQKLKSIEKTDQIWLDQLDLLYFDTILILIFD